MCISVPLLKFLDDGLALNGIMTMYGNVVLCSKINIDYLGPAEKKRSGVYRVYRVYLYRVDTTVAVSFQPK